MVSGRTCPIEIAVHPESDRRRAILDAATELFDAQGFAGTTTDQLAARAGITKRTLYRHMGSKEQILFEIHERFLDRTIMNAVTARVGSSVDRFAGMVQVHVSVVITHQQEIRVFLEDMKHLGPENRAEISRRRDDYEAALSLILSEGMEDGTFPHREAHLLARAILGALTEIYRWYRPRTDAPSREIVSAALPMFLDGLSRVGGEVVTRPGHVLAKEVPTLPPQNEQDHPDARIFSAATELFCRKGYHGANTRELAAAANMTKSALFYHIGRKEAILSRIHHVVVDAGIDSLQALLEEESASAAELLTKATIAHCRTIDRYRDAIAVSHEEMKHLPPDARSELGARRNIYETMFRSIITRGTQSGQFHAADEQLTTRILLGMLNSTYRWYRPGGALSADEIGIRYADLVLRGLRSDAGVAAAGRPRV